MVYDLYSYPAVWALLLALNVLAFGLYGLDKRRARSGHRRIREHTLLLVAALGGSAGAWLGMRLWHHKTLHWKFRLGLPFILVVQLVVAVWWLGS